MATYIEYDLGNGSTLLIEAPESEEAGMIKAARNGAAATIKAQKGFAEALKDIKIQANLLINEIEDLHVNEAEIRFGISTVGELGNLAIGKIGLGVNYEVTLKWSKLTKKTK